MPLHPSMRLNLKAPRDHDDHPAGVQPREDAVTLDRYKIDEVIDTTVVKEHPDMPGEKLYYVDPAPAAASTSSDSSSYSDSGSEDEASPKVLIGSKAAKQVPPPTPVDSETGGKAAKQVPPPTMVDSETGGKAAEQVPPPTAVGSETEGKAAEQVPPPTPVDPEMGGKAAKQVPPRPVVEVAGKAVGEQVPPPTAVEMGGKAVGEQVPPPTAVATEARVGDPMLVDQVQDPSKGNSASKDPAEVEAISSEEEGANLKGAFKDRKPLESDPAKLSEELVKATLATLTLMGKDASVDILQAQRKVRDALKNLQEQPSDPAREETVAPPATKKRKKESEKPTSDQVKLPVEEEQLFVPGADEKGVLQYLTKSSLLPVPEGAPLKKSFCVSPPQNSSAAIKSIEVKFLGSTASFYPKKCAEHMVPKLQSLSLCADKKGGVHIAMRKHGVANGWQLAQRVAGWTVEETREGLSP
ncbi:unnamed protein product [Durusdinium trenchii]|uniref:Uncharacterized protein n=1 Tax=Durusdinium trenchii TaxID=1381693 RepID=A0ABP0H7G0_9DINO